MSPSTKLHINCVSHEIFAFLLSSHPLSLAIETPSFAFALPSTHVQVWRAE